MRLNLLEHIYETLYTQRIQYGNTASAENSWPHRILPYRTTVDVENSPLIPDGVRLHVRNQSPLYLCDSPGASEVQEVLDVDAVFVATGYRRDLHETLLQDARYLLPGGDLEGAKWAVERAKWAVERDYRVCFQEGRVGSEAGVWLQGCCESTHGVSRPHHRRHVS